MLIEWNVFNEDINSKKIVKFNVFNHFGFLTDIIKMFKDVKKEQDRYRKENKLSGELTLKQYNEYEKYMLGFEDAYLNTVCMRTFGSKSEYETTLTSWPPYITDDELSRLNKEFTEHVLKYAKHPKVLNINPYVNEKIDIYYQLKLNWEIFKNYIFCNKKEIKKLYNKRLKDLNIGGN